MIKIAVGSNGDKQVYSDTVGSHGRAEVLTFMVDYVETKNEMGGMYMIKDVVKPAGKFYYFDLFGKWKDTVDQAMVDKFNSEIKK